MHSSYPIHINTFTWIYTLNNYDVCYTTGIHIKISEIFFQKLCHTIFSSYLQNILELLLLYTLDMFFSSGELLLKNPTTVIWVPAELHWRWRKLTWPMVSEGCVKWQKSAFDQSLFSFLGKMGDPSFSCFHLPCSWWVCITLTSHQAQKTCINSPLSIEKLICTKSTDTLYVSVEYNQHSHKVKHTLSVASFS